MDKIENNYKELAEYIRNRYLNKFDSLKTDHCNLKNFEDVYIPEELYINYIDKNFNMRLLSDLRFSSNDILKAKQEAAISKQKYNTEDLRISQNNPIVKRAIESDEFKQSNTVVCNHYRIQKSLTYDYLGNNKEIIVELFGHRGYGLLHIFYLQICKSSDLPYTNYDGKLKSVHTLSLLDNETTIIEVGDNTVSMITKILNDLYSKYLPYLIYSYLIKQTFAAELQEFHFNLSMERDNRRVADPEGDFWKAVENNNIDSWKEAHGFD